MSSANQSWWAGSSSRARWTALGAAIITLVLAGISVIVWTSPSNPVQQTIASVSGAVVAQDASKRDRAKLLQQVVALKLQISELKASNEATAEELAAVQSELWSTQGALSAAEAASSSLREQLAAAEAAVPRPRSGGGSAGSGGSSGGGSGSKPAPAPAPITAPSKDEILAADGLWGMYTSQAPFNFATYDETASKVGSTPSVVGYFGGWDEAFRANAVTRSWERDLMPILTWEARPIDAENNVVEAPEYSLPRILDGAFDEYLHQYARDIVATGLPLGIRLNHEMNGSWYPWSEVNTKEQPINGNNRGDYAKVWQKVHDIFEQEGANQYVVWIWAPNIINNLPKAHQTPEFLASYYPGDEYVDWVGLSGYLRPPYKPEQTFTFEYSYGRTLEQLRALTDKPILLAEIGASEIDGHKAEWITSFFQALAKPENDDVIGFSWFNLAVTTYVEGERATNDWRIDSRADTLEAFRVGITAPDSDFTQPAFQ